ncbi:MAG: hypothetical protein V1720_21395 [bacterium]
MKLDKAKIRLIFEETAVKLGFFPIEINFRGNEKTPVIEIFIDNQIGMTSDDCAHFSREITDVIELQNVIECDYRLDVSSPGVARSLKFIGQYPKHINRNFDVIYTDGDEEKKITGKLIRIENNDLFFGSGKNEIIVNFEKIKKALVKISF